MLAARASELAAQGKNVLVVSYNITLLNYLRDLAVRHVAPRQVIRRQIEFINFHYWCRRVCFKTGQEAAYKSLWLNTEANSQSVLDEDMPSLVQKLYRDRMPVGQNIMPKYDAILVDEGQDFRLSWWRTLRLALEPHGEMVLVADKTQNIYGTAAGWTEDAMANAGFRGPWAELKTAYRLPSAIAPLVRSFAEEFLTEEEVSVPEPKQREIEVSPVDLRWVHVHNHDDTLYACKRELLRMMKRLPSGTANSDITFLSGEKLGSDFVKSLNQMDVKVLHTFGNDALGAHGRMRADAVRSRRRKRAFFQGTERIKATTVHSFKGWEARLIIVCVESIGSAGDSAVLYTALTRLLDHPSGSCLTVVSSCPALQMYGKSWPTFDEFRTAPYAPDNAPADQRLERGSRD